MERKIGTNYTTIMHGPRIELELSCNEYCIADMVYHLSHETGWCYASKERLAGFIGLSKQTVLGIIERLVSRGLVEIHDDRRMLRTTMRWHDAVIVFRNAIRGKETSRSVTSLGKSQQKTTQSGGQETSPYIYSIQNNTEKSGYSVPEKPFSQLRQKNIELAASDVKRPDPETLAILEQFSDEFIRRGYGNSRPIIKADGYYAVFHAKRYLSFQQMKDRLTDWLYTAKSADLPHITRAFSSKSITSWKNEQGL